jgi:hypothetical protein
VRPEIYHRRPRVEILIAKGHGKGEGSREFISAENAQRVPLQVVVLSAQGELHSSGR